MCSQVHSKTGHGTFSSQANNTKKKQIMLGQLKIARTLAVVCIIPNKQMRKKQKA